MSLEELVEQLKPLKDKYSKDEMHKSVVEGGFSAVDADKVVELIYGEPGPVVPKGKDIQASLRQVELNGPKPAVSVPSPVQVPKPVPVSKSVPESKFPEHLIATKPAGSVPRKPVPDTPPVSAPVVPEKVVAPATLVVSEPPLPSVVTSSGEEVVLEPHLPTSGVKSKNSAVDKLLNWFKKKPKE